MPYLLLEIISSDEISAIEETCEPTTWCSKLSISLSRFTFHRKTFWSIPALTNSKLERNRSPEKRALIMENGKKRS